MTAQPKADSQAIVDEFQSLRMQNVPVNEARKFLAEKYERSVPAIRALTNRGTASQHDPSTIDPLQTDFAAFGTSTLYDADGNVKLQWVKRRKQEEEEQFRIAVEAMTETLPKVKPSSPRSTKFRSDTIAVYPMGDPHFGMFAWSEETGDDFDLKIAERDLCAAVDRLVDTVPACKEAMIINLGDFFHADNGHPADAGRLGTLPGQ